MENENKMKKQLFEEIEELRIRLEEAEETLNAIRSGEVDAIVVSGPQGDQVFTLTGAEQAYRVLIETMNEGAAVLNQEGMIIYCNQCLSEMIKTPLEKVIGVPMRQFIRASDLPVFDSLIEKGLQESAKGEVAFIKNDGTVLPALLSISALHRDNANMCNITVTDLTAQKHFEEELRRHRDNLEELVKERTNELETSNQRLRKEITERKQAGEALRQSQLKYKNIIRTTQDSFWYVDSDGRFLDVNDAACKMLGYERGELLS
jgi:two-component system CheB/CheR fusion protein